MNRLNKVLLSLSVVLALSGCAASDYRNARAQANLVQNGMTVAEATRVLGLPPSHQGADFVEWRRGNAQKYNATANGAIRFELQDGKIVNVPEGGIFSAVAQKQLNDAWLLARQADDDARAAQEKAAEDARLAVDVKAEDARRAAKVKSEQESARRAEELKREIAKETAARANAFYTCVDKIMCNKAFSLAQIYVAQNADQKIQVATDTIIQTYNPTDSGNIGMSIVKTPGKGAREIIEITVTCKGSDGELFASLCSKKRTVIYAGFRPFIEARLQR